MGAFTTLVADDKFADGINEPYSEWAIVICLWLRRVSQVCTALGPSMHTSHAQKVLDHAVQQLHEKRHHQDQWCELAVCRAMQEAALPPQLPDSGAGQYVNDFLEKPSAPRRQCTPNQFIKAFLHSGHGTPVLAERPAKDAVLACERFGQQGSLFMPQLG